MLPIIAVTSPDFASNVILFNTGSSDCAYEKFTFLNTKCPLSETVSLWPFPSTISGSISNIWFTLSAHAPALGMYINTITPMIK